MKRASISIGRRTVPGFTIVELLVVISIIAMLVSLLLPALTQAREQAYATRCASQLKQLGIGVRAYIDGNKGWMPVGGWSGIGTTSYTWARTAAVELDLPYLTEQNIPSTGAYARQWVNQTVNRERLRKNGIFQCPSDKSLNYWGGVHSTSYGWNAGYATGGVTGCLGVGDRFNSENPIPSMRRIREIEVRTPSDTFCIGEQMPRPGYTEENQTQFAGNVPISTYHLGKSNMLWVDLRATSISQTDVIPNRFKRAP